MDAREDSYIQNLIKMIADLRQESYKQLQRIEALEAAQQPQQSVPKWHRLSEREPQVGDRCIYQCPPNLLHAFGTWHDTSTEHISRKGFWNNERGLFVGDPECISWRLAMLHEIPPATEESSATAPPAPAGGQRRYPSPATIAECGGPCDSQGHEACDCGLLQELNPPSPAPAGGLVERVAEAMERHHVTGDIEGSWDAQARAAISRIAAATDQMAPDRNLTWERVALWLEREANQ